MMTAIVGDLGKWGVPARNIHYEAFGEATVRKVAPVTNVATDDMAAVKVTFARSNSNAKWTPNAGSLLELMESAGIPIDSGCRAGNCGTCHVAIRSGQVTYLKKAAASIEPNGCLPCIVIPNSDLLLDA
jgi:ferredoxin